jgi:outer membrane protein assembly factor BamE (lipoprotein component of BamABCDE complex)
MAPALALRKTAVHLVYFENYLFDCAIVRRLASLSSSNRRAASPLSEVTYHRGLPIMNKLTLPALIAAGLSLAACVPMYDYSYSEAAMYSPGGQLADKQEGPVILASATDSSLAAMFPKGTNKAQVMQALGNPASSSTVSDGTSVQMFNHSFTSYRMKSLQAETLIVEYDRANTVTKLTLSKVTNNW